MAPKWEGRCNLYMRNLVGNMALQFAKALYVDTQKSGMGFMKKLKEDVTRLVKYESVQCIERGLD